MADRQKLVYIVVQDGESEVSRTPPPRYTRPLLQSTLQLMGCKPRHSFKISDRVFDMFKSDLLEKKIKDRKLAVDGALRSQEAGDLMRSGEKGKVEAEELEIAGHGLKKPSKLSRKRSTATVSREKFLDVACEALAEYQYVGPNQRSDLMLACRVRERKQSVTILLCGTSGCGKSTLSSLLAGRLGITTVVSTDSVRHMMRSFVGEKENPLLWASTYHAGDHLDPEAVAEAKAKKKAAKMASIPLRTSSLDSGVPNGTISEGSGKSCAEGLELSRRDGEGGSSHGKSISNHGSHTHDSGDIFVGSKTMAVQGFKAQSEMVIDSLDRLITAWEQKCESVVVEGVHLSLNFVMGLMKKHPSIIPFMVYIGNEDKHLERFAVRAKYMTLDPAKNKYVKYIRNIRTIQEYLCKRADKHLVPKVNNTNVDKSVAAIHATIFSSIRRREKGEPLFDQATNTVKVVNQEYRSQYAASALGSKGMFQLLQRQGSSRHLMALINVDGSVAKAWPIQNPGADGKLLGNGDNNEIGNPVYGPIMGQIGKAEHVNLHFGKYGLSAWPNDVGGTSHHGSLDGNSPRGDPYEVYSTGSRSSSPQEGAAKNHLDDEVSVSGSEEEPEEELSPGSDAENSCGESEAVDDREMEGSVEDTTDEEDVEQLQEAFDADDGYWTDELEEDETKRAGNSDAFPSVDETGQLGGPGKLRHRGPGPAAGHFQSGKMKRSATTVDEESTQFPELAAKPLTSRGLDHLNIVVPPLGTRLQSRSRSSAVR